MQILVITCIWKKFIKCECVSAENLKYLKKEKKISVTELRKYNGMSLRNKFVK